MSVLTNKFDDSKGIDEKSLIPERFSNIFVVLLEGGYQNKLLNFIWGRMILRKQHKFPKVYGVFVKKYVPITSMHTKIV